MKSSFVLRPIKNHDQERQEGKKAKIDYMARPKEFVGLVEIEANTTVYSIVLPAMIIGKPRLQD